MIKNYTLKILYLSKESDRAKYEEYHDKYLHSSLYYSYNHIKFFTQKEDNILCFILMEGSNIEVLMPVIRRNVDSNLFNHEEQYYDIVSPYGYSGPFFCKDTSDNIKVDFWKKVDEWYKQNNIISEFIRFSLNGNHEFYSGVKIETLKNVRGKIEENFEENWVAFSSKVRNNFRKAKKNNLTIRFFENSDISDIVTQQFIEIYEKTMKRRNARDVFYFSEDYFRNIINGNKENFIITLVYLNGKAISTELIFLDKNSDCIYAFLGGTDSEFFSVRPNDFLRVNVIEWASSKKYKYYILGGGLKDNDGLYKSKKALFPKQEDFIFFTGRKIINKDKYDVLSENLDDSYQENKNDLIKDDYFPYYRKVIL